MWYLHTAKCEHRWSLWWLALVSLVHTGWSFLTANIRRYPKEDRKGDRVLCPALQLYLPLLSLLPTSPCPVCLVKWSTLYQILPITWLDLEEEKRAQVFSRSHVAGEFWEVKPPERSPNCSKKEQSSQETECPGRMETVSGERPCSRSHRSCESGPRTQSWVFPDCEDLRH